MPKPPPQTNSTPDLTARPRETRTAMGTTSMTEGKPLILKPGPLPLPGLGHALFSTELGTRPANKLTGLLHEPVIVRSGDKTKAVVDAAKYWQNKYLWQTLCIFPNGGWQIYDLWDAKEIHKQTPEFCAEMLTFMSRDTYWWAKKYAQDWVRTYPQAAKELLGGADLKGIYDPVNPLDIVDKIFVNGETQGLPKQFLWHVANIIRTEILAPRKEQVKAVADAKQADSPSSAQSIDSPIQDEKALTNPSRDPSPIAIAHGPPSSSVAVKANTADLVKRSSSYGSAPLSNSTCTDRGRLVDDDPKHPTPPPAFAESGLHNPKGRNRNAGPATYQPNISSGASTENIPYGPAVAHPHRQTGGGLVAQHTYVAHHGAMAMAPPLTGGYPMVQSFGPVPPVSTVMQQAPPYHVLVPQPMMPVSSMNMPLRPSMSATYPYQHPNEGFRGTSFGDKTNKPNVSNGGSPEGGSHQNLDRRSSGLSEGNGAERDFQLYNNSHHFNKKFGRDHSDDYPAVARRPSSSASHYGPSKFGIGRQDASFNSSRRQSLHSDQPIGKLVDDSRIVNDALGGCGPNWIGADNVYVDELLVMDLPKNIHSDEVYSMFLCYVKIMPADVEVKHSTYAHRPFEPERSPLPKAFVKFKSVSDAKSALNIFNVGPHIRNHPVRVVVPKRFFSKSPARVDLPQAEHQPAVERGLRVATGISPEHDADDLKSRAVQPLYTPQDARSGAQALITSNGRCGGAKEGGVNTPMNTESGVGCEDANKPECEAEVERGAVAMASAEVEGKTGGLEEEVAVKEDVVVDEPLEDTTGQVEAESVAACDPNGPHYTSTNAKSVVGDEERPGAKADSHVHLEQAEGTPPPHEDVSFQDDAEADSSFVSAQEVNAAVEPLQADEVHIDNAGQPAAVAMALVAPLDNNSLPTLLSPPPTPLPSLPTPLLATPALDSNTCPTQHLSPVPSATTMAPPPVEADMAKACGPQQTPSLTPFAKVTKSQKKKEKERKRKLKKEQESLSLSVNQPEVPNTFEAMGDRKAASAALPTAPPAAVSAAEPASTNADNLNASAQTVKTSTSGKKGKAQAMPGSTHGQDKIDSVKVVVDELVKDTKLASIVDASRKLTITKLDTNIQESSARNNKDAAVAPPNVVPTQSVIKDVEPALSVASSDTLHPEDGRIASPSSATEMYHTPLQTPVGVDDAEVDDSKPKKKRKPRKKKAKNATVPEDHVEAASPEETSAPKVVLKASDYKDDPFGHQLFHIDTIREANKNASTSSYYKEVNDEMTTTDKANGVDGQVKNMPTQTDGKGSGTKVDKGKHKRTKIENAEREVGGVEDAPGKNKSTKSDGEDGGTKVDKGKQKRTKVDGEDGKDGSVDNEGKPRENDADDSKANKKSKMSEAQRNQRVERQDSSYNIEDLARRFFLTPPAEQNFVFREIQAFYIESGLFATKYSPEARARAKAMAEARRKNGGKGPTGTGPPGPPGPGGPPGPPGSGPPGPGPAGSSAPVTS